jgi:hypothetical protein
MGIELAAEVGQAQVVLGSEVQVEGGLGQGQEWCALGAIGLGQSALI